MTWEEYYSKFYGWATSTQIKRLPYAMLNADVNPAESVDVAWDILDEKAAGRLMKRAANAGIQFANSVKVDHKEAETLAFLQKSVATMVGHIDGLLCAEINANTAGGEYDLVFYSELRDADALQAFQNHPLHIAHRERCKALVTDRLCGDMEAD